MIFFDLERHYFFWWKDYQESCCRFHHIEWWDFVFKAISIDALERPTQIGRCPLIDVHRTCAIKFLQFVDTACYFKENSRRGTCLTDQVKKVYPWILDVRKTFLLIDTFTKLRAVCMKYKKHEFDIGTNCLDFRVFQLGKKDLVLGTYFMNWPRGVVQFSLIFLFMNL